MKIRFLETSAPGVTWMRRYFDSQPQLDRRAAFDSFKKAKALLKSHPNAGALFEDFDDVREVHITRTAFSILYKIVGETVFIIDIRDGRGLRSATALRKHADEIARKNDLPSPDTSPDN